MVLSRYVPDPNGHWSLTVHLNAIDIYKGVADDGKHWQHDNCLRCQPSFEDDVQDTYPNPGDTRAAILPLVHHWLARHKIKLDPEITPGFHTFFCSKPRRTKKEIVKGNLPAFATNSWRCHCPVHGKFTYTVEESFGI